MAKEFDFMGMVTDMAKKIEDAAKEMRARTMFGYFWDGKVTQGETELDKLSDEHLKRLVIQGNIMVSKAAQIRSKREVEQLRKDGSHGMG